MPARRAGTQGQGEYGGVYVMWKITCAMTAAVAALLVSGVRADNLGGQDAPPAAPAGLVLVAAGDGYRLEWQYNPQDEAGHVISIEARYVGGREAGGISLGATPPGQTFFVLPSNLGVAAGACYDARFVVYAASADPAEILGDPALLETRLCIGDGGDVSFPSLPVDGAPPPLPPSDVRVVRRGGAYYVTWRDNSGDETHFQASVNIASENGQALQLGMVSANVTSLAVPVEQIDAPPGCYDATVYVFAARGGIAHGWAGTQQLPLCVGADNVGAFPGVGAGGVRRGGPPVGGAQLAGLALLALGGWLLRAGVRARRVAA